MACQRCGAISPVSVMRWCTTEMLCAACDAEEQGCPNVAAAQAAAGGRRVTENEYDFLTVWITKQGECLAEALALCDQLTDRLGADLSEPLRQQIGSAESCRQFIRHALDAEEEP